LSILNNSNAIATGGGYNLESSLRFRSSASAYLTRTFGSGGNRQKYTWSGWMKLGAIRTSQDIFFGYGETYFQIAGSGGQIGGNFRSGGTNYFFDSNMVLRDPSAWYHVVYSIDTTQATASNRVKIYVNNQLVTFATANYPPQNHSTDINISGAAHNIGRYSGGGYHWDGYMTEVNFVDAQQLTPSDFGEYNTDTGVWQPKEYTGSYGTTGFYLPFDSATASGFTDHFTDLTGGQSVQVVDNAVIEPGSSAFCIEFWCRPDSLPSQQENYICKGSSGYAAYIIGRYSGVSGDGTLTMYGSSSGSSWNVFNNETFGTVSAGSWHHLAFYRIGNNFYGAVNGNVRFIKTYTGAIWNNGNNLFIGTDGGGGSQSDIDVSNFRMVIGSSVYGTTNFTPPTAPLTAISGTKILTLQDSTFIDNSGSGVSIITNGSPTLTSGTVGNYVTIGNDSSGNGNDWTTSNMNVTDSTTTTYDVMTDVPTLTDEDTSNFCTLNYLTKWSNVTLANANLEVTNVSSGGGNGGVAGTHIMTSGSWYWEFTANHNYSSVGVALADEKFPTTGFTTDQWTWMGQGYYYKNSSSPVAATAYGSGDVIGLAFNADTGALVGYKNNVSVGTIATGLTAVNGYVPFFCSADGATGGKFNFGQRPFKYTPPTGYKKLNTYNLPDSTIKDGSQHFDTLLYTGNGANRSITGLNFSPDLVIGQSRSNAYGNWWFDTNRGATKQMESWTGNAESTQATMVTAFNSNGFSLGTDAAGNQSGATYVAWNLRGSDSTAVSNTNGTVTSTVSANPTAGFSIVTWTGNGANATIGHGLGVKPACYIVKRRNGATSWCVYHEGISTAPQSAYIYLENTNAAVTGSNVFWNGTVPTTTTFGVSSHGDVNASGGTYVAYVFANIEGFSKFSKYTGNGSADGAFIYTGFRPAVILHKRSDAAENWSIWTPQAQGNGISSSNNFYLLPNSSSAQDTTQYIDTLSNGFKIRDSGSFANANNGTYIYMAFAENPFKNALAR